MTPGTSALLGRAGCIICGAEGTCGALCQQPLRILRWRGSVSPGSGPRVARPCKEARALGEPETLADVSFLSQCPEQMADTFPNGRLWLLEGRREEGPV